nr:EAL domain-containing protein [Caldimonas mangrovi]
MIAVARSTGAPLHLSPALVRYAGLDQLDDWLDRWEPASRATLQRALAQPVDFSLPLSLQVDDRLCRLHGAGHWVPHLGLHVCLFDDGSAGRQAELATRAQSDLLRLTADNVPALIAYYEAEHFRCVFANKQYAHSFGWDERSIIGHTFSEVIGEEATCHIQPYVDHMLRHRQPVSYERRRAMPDGSPQWIEVSLLPHLDAGGRPMAAFVLIVDITKHRLAEQAVRESEERLAKFMQASAEGVVFHQDGIITDVNPPVCRLTGYAFEELLGRHTLEFVPVEYHARVIAVWDSGEDATYESEIVTRDGERVPVEFIGRTMERNGERLRMSIVRDIRDRHAAQARIHHLAHHDALTGLPNRMSFMEHLDRRMALARTTNEQMALLFIDLDDFKRVNDSLGHLAGDKLLQTIAVRVTDTLRATDRVARFGGDEFMVLLPHARHRHDVEDVARKLLAAIEVPVDADGRLISVTPSIGVAMFPGDAQSPAELIKHADSAMYLAKSRGRANYQFFDPAMVQTAYDALVMESQLVQALERDEFVLHFQPQVRTRDQALVGAEALIRWNHPQQGLLYPDRFIPVAEQQRLMLPLGQWVLREAVRCARGWRAAGLTGAPIGVNLSTVQFQSAGFVEAVERVLQEEGVPGEALELELSERMLMDDLPDVMHKLTRLKALGIRIAVDDFGTGYFSLRHLKELPIDKVKIDRSFVQDLPHAQDAAAIVRAIIQMAHSLGQSVIAEGVETTRQLDFLATQGCEELQGDLISAPLPAVEFENWMRRS